jgi:hypothetical protein
MVYLAKPPPLSRQGADVVGTIVEGLPCRVDALPVDGSST